MPMLHASLGAPPSLPVVPPLPREPDGAAGSAPEPPPLLARVAAGDEAAFRALVVRHRGLVARVAYRILRGAHDIDDVCQDVFLALWRSAASYDPESGDEATFVATIARRRIIDRRRAELARPRRFEELPQAAVPDGLDSYVDARTAAAALGRLGPDPHQVVLLAAHGFTREEIAEELSLPLGTVKSHYTRALERVHRELRRARRPVAAPVVRIAEGRAQR